MTTIFSVVDKTVVLRHDWGIGIAYYSPRTHNYEDAGENKRGWHQSEGMVYINNADVDQYNGNFWPTVDSHRLAGTTIAMGSTGGSARANGNSFAGGAQLDRYFAAVGFTLKPGHEQTLVANKAWLIFGDEVVCLGSGITSTNGKEIETVVENRRLRADGTNVLTVDGVMLPTTRPWTSAYQGVHWMHLAGSVPGSDIGYVFPLASDLTLIRAARTDSWSAVHVNSSTAPVTESYFTAVTSHGINPTDANYAYILLPNRTTAEIASYAVNPAVTILANGTNVSAARQNQSDVTGALFWQDASTSLGLPGGVSLWCDKKSAVVLRDQPRLLDLAVSDPTQANTGFIDLELSEPVSHVVSFDAAITVLQQTPTLKLRVNVAQAKGRTFHAQFSK